MRFPPVLSIRYRGVRRRANNVRPPHVIVAYATDGVVVFFDKNLRETLDLEYCFDLPLYL